MLILQRVWIGKINTVITAIIHNIGNFGASNIYVRFIDLTADQQIGVDQYITEIDTGANTQITIQWTPTFAASHVIRISVDPDNTIGENLEINTYPVKVENNVVYIDIR